MMLDSLPSKPEWPSNLERNFLGLRRDEPMPLFSSPFMSYHLWTCDSPQESLEENCVFIHFVIKFVFY